MIKNCWIIKDVKIGNCCYIKGASKLKNITINSSEVDPTQIGENVVLVNGIIGYGCRLFYSVIAVRFVLGDYAGQLQTHPPADGRHHRPGAQGHGQQRAEQAGVKYLYYSGTVLLL